jgi:hypothetical protein
VASAGYVAGRRRGGSSRSSPLGACDPGDGLGGRESISIFPHTNDFVGISARTPERVGAAGRVNQGRWVYEGGKKMRAKEEKSARAQPGR